MPGHAVFSEKAFYLAEFRGRTLGIALPSGQLEPPAALVDVVRELSANATRVVVMAADRAALADALGVQPLDPDAPWVEAAAWRQARQLGCAALALPAGAGFADTVRALALRLGLAKLVRIDAGGGFRGGDGVRLSFVDQAELAAGRVHDTRAELMDEIRRMLDDGLPSVNVCTLPGLADELFTYAGTGTLFTRERYVAVRRLRVDDFDAAADLIARGVEEGFLAPRPPEEIDRILACAHGAFVEGRYLAGIGALIPHVETTGTAAAGAGEIASLYTLTRFLGEGVGGPLVSFAVEAARERGLEYAFACTTSERVVRFFVREGFREVGQDQVPDAKWKGYDAARRQLVRCVRRDVA